MKSSEWACRRHAHCFEGNSLRGKALRPAPRFRDDSAVQVRWAERNLVNEGADGVLILYGCGKWAVPLPHCGSDGNRGLILFREVNDLIWTPEASTLFGLCFLRFCRVIPAVLLAKNADVSGVRFHSFTSRKSIRPRFVGSGESLSWMSEMCIAAGGSPEAGCSAS